MCFCFSLSCASVLHTVFSHLSSPLLSQWVSGFFGMSANGHFSSCESCVRMSAYTCLSLLCMSTCFIICYSRMPMVIRVYPSLFAYLSIIAVLLYSPWSCVGVMGTIVKVAQSNLNPIQCTLILSECFYNSFRAKCNDSVTSGMGPCAYHTV